MCLTCGHVGCCDSSRGRHATAHFEATGHPLMRSVEPGETWAWCYVDRQGCETAEVALEDPPAHEADQLESARPFVDALYREFLGRGIEYFFPEARLEMLGAAAGGRARAGELEFDGFSFRYRLSTAEGAFSTDEARLLDSILRVLSARYHVLFDAALAARRLHRLCDGLQTLALVGRDGMLVELVDVHEWAAAYAGLPLPVPTIERYAAHSRATLCGGHVCLVLTPNGEIKIFADGRQVFSFL